MDIILNNLSKRFDSGWVFKGLDFNIKKAEKIAIEGANGSGKSTLLNILCGYLSPSRGKLIYKYESREIDRDDLYKYLAISTAYTEMDEELNPKELFKHYSRFKNYLLKSPDEFIEVSQLTGHHNKVIKNFSSGMKQRLNLALAICTDTPLLFLDEPSSFLDDERKEWFEQMMNKYTSNKTVIIASNESSDLKLCTRSIKLTAS